MTPLRVIAVDDEPLALRRLQLVIQSLPDVALVGQARTLAEAVRLIAAERPDAILLDIQLGDQTGFDILDALAETECPDVVFVTAFSHHAAAAFDRKAVDYVLKPVEADRLSEALRRVRAHASMIDSEDRIRELRAIVETLRQSSAPAAPRYETEFWIRRGARDLVRVPIASIETASAEEDYVRLVADGRSWLMRETLAGLERRLPPGEFLRVHRAHLVRARSIAALHRTPTGALEVLLENGLALPVGRVNAKALRERLAGCGPQA